MCRQGRKKENKDINANKEGFREECSPGSGISVRQRGCQCQPVCAEAAGARSRHTPAGKSVYFSSSTYTVESRGSWSIFFTYSCREEHLFQLQAPSTDTVESRGSWSIFLTNSCRKNVCFSSKHQAQILLSLEVAGANFVKFFQVKTCYFSSCTEHRCPAIQCNRTQINTHKHPYTCKHIHPLLDA